MRLGVVLVFLVVLAGCIEISGVDGTEYVVTRSGSDSGAQFAVLPVDGNVLRALVKGSIYESGEAVSVFGTCLNQTDGGFLNSYASMSSWYPNGTLFFENVSMYEIQTGYFVYTGSMSAVQGTYLTEMTCHVNGTDTVARAFGEWQNPMWVQRISNISQGVADLQVQVGELNVTLQDQFVQTWEQINNTYVNISNEIDYAVVVSNGSVDRNDSYIVSLLYQILANGTPSTGPAGSVSFIESAESPRFRTVWTINVTAYIGSTQVGSEYVGCFINTTNNPVTENAIMEPIAGPMFTYSELVRSVDDFDWDVWCVTV